jgi:transcriptional regulator with XRE-family HTH domain
MTPLQCKLGRTALGWTVRKLAHEAKVTANTVSRFETGQTAAQPSTLAMMRQALERGGVIFVDNGDGEGVKLRRT